MEQAGEKALAGGQDLALDAFFFVDLSSRDCCFFAISLSPCGRARHSLSGSSDRKVLAKQ